jgi:hypothetical protein
VFIKKILTAAVLLLASASAVLAQSGYTTGTIASSERAGYGSPYEYGDGLYDYASRRFYSHAVGRLKR